MSGHDYATYHARQAVGIRPVPGARVLVVGCNTGRDCVPFVEAGAAEVHGLDVTPDVGSEYVHPRAFYHLASAERMPFRDRSFDLVYAVATMEHVPRIDLAFAEMARVTAPGGYVYCVASPLWNSRFGHHKGDLVPDAPWIHLRCMRDEIVAYCRGRGIEEYQGAGIAEHVDYMLDSRFFNKTPASAYIATCRRLNGLWIIANALDLDDAFLLPDEAYGPLMAKGYSRTELLAVTHTFIGTRKLIPSVADLARRFRFVPWLRGVRARLRRYLPSMRRKPTQEV